MNTHRPCTHRAPITLWLFTVVFPVAIRGENLPSTTPTSSPNFIIIMADDMGYGDASCYGNTRFKTPQLDRLAAEGLKFTDFHSSGNVCSPTRAGLLTGRYQHRAGIPSVVNAGLDTKEHYWGLQQEEITFAEILKEAGYATGLFGKWHLGYTQNYNPIHHGFDRFRGFVSGNIDYHSHYDRIDVYDWWDGTNLINEEGYTTHLITQHTLAFIEEHHGGPFCAYVPYEAVHAPWQGPGDPPQRGPQKVNKDVDQQRAFRDMLLAMDMAVGQIVDKVRDLGLAEKTLIFFCSDNGPAGGSAGPLRGRKGSNWEGGHRVPAIAWWPGTISPGSVTDQLAITLDLMPTMLELSGAAVPDGHKLDGVSLVPLLTQAKSLGQRQLYWNDQAMRDGSWKLMAGPKGGLFNLESDLGETTNLAAKYPARAAAMREALKAWSAEVRVGATVQPDPPAGSPASTPSRR